MFPVARVKAKCMISLFERGWQELVLFPLFVAIVSVIAFGGRTRPLVRGPDKQFLTSSTDRK
jgi:predicted ABC-type exoprotein transport system permease subunit